MYDYNEAGDYILKESYAKNVRDKIGNSIKEILLTIKENRDKCYKDNEERVKKELLEAMAPESTNAEVVEARGVYSKLSNRLMEYENEITRLNKKFKQVDYSLLNVNVKQELVRSKPLAFTKIGGNVSCASPLITLKTGFVYKINIVLQLIGGIFIYYRLMTASGGAIAGNSNMQGLATPPSSGILYSPTTPEYESI